MTGIPGKSQKEGQEDQGEAKEGGSPLDVLRTPGPPGLLSGFSLTSPQARRFAHCLQRPSNALKACQALLAFQRHCQTTVDIRPRGAGRRRPEMAASLGGPGDETVEEESSGLAPSRTLTFSLTGFPNDLSAPALGYYDWAKGPFKGRRARGALRGSKPSEGLQLEKEGLRLAQADNGPRS